MGGTVSVAQTEVIFGELADEVAQESSTPGSVVPGLSDGLLTTALTRRQPRGQLKGPAQPPAGIDGQPERDPPDPRLGQVVAGDLRPPGQRPGEGLLGDVLRLLAVADDRGHQRDHPAVAGFVELREVLMLGRHVTNTPEDGSVTSPIR